VTRIAAERACVRPRSDAVKVADVAGDGSRKCNDEPECVLRIPPREFQNEAKDCFDDFHSDLSFFLLLICRVFAPQPPMNASKSICLNTADAICGS